MSTYFFYENGQGKIYNEQGKDAMEWVEEVDPFHLETLTTLRKYQQAQPSEQEWMRGELDETMNEVALRTKEEGNKKKAEKAIKYIPLTRRHLHFLSPLQTNTVASGLLVLMTAVATLVGLCNMFGRLFCEQSLWAWWNP